MSLLYRRELALASKWMKGEGSQVTSKGNEKAEFTPIKGVIFDMDGTLTKPVLNFSEMRKQLGVQPGGDIMTHINSLSMSERAKALQIVERIEEEANKKMELQPGTLELLDFLASKSIKRGLLTLNAQNSTDQFLARLHDSLTASSSLCSSLTPGNFFSQVVTREFQPNKPDPAPVCHMASIWELPTENLLVVGDGKADVISGHKAGTMTALLMNNLKEQAASCELTPGTPPCDIMITSLYELLDRLQKPIIIATNDNKPSADSL